MDSWLFPSLPDCPPDSSTQLDEPPYELSTPWILHPMYYPLVLRMSGGGGKLFDHRGALCKVNCWLKIYEKVSQEGIEPEITSMPSAHAIH